jgi:putative DNA primase/helicase
MRRSPRGGADPPAVPAFFSLVALDFGFDCNAPEPTEWLRFLGSLWPDDPEAVATLQEWFGYCLVSDTKQQKILLVVGPKRSGKGTIARVLTALLGRANVVAPTLASMGQNFGMAPLIGKLLAIIADARLSHPADQQAIAERLLTVSGEDALTIDRKHIEPWTGRLATRFMLRSNELPRIADASGALARRFIVPTLKRSFYGIEDLGLTDRLLRELPGILNWGIMGLRRLQDRGHFVQPASSAEAIQELEDLSRPVGAFLREKCEIGASLEVGCIWLFEQWKRRKPRTAVLRRQGRDHPGTVQSFGRDLRAAVPALEVIQPRLSDRLRRRRSAPTAGRQARCEGLQWPSEGVGQSGDEDVGLSGDEDVGLRGAAEAKVRSLAALLRETTMHRTKVRTRPRRGSTYRRKIIYLIRDKYGAAME